MACVAPVSAVSNAVLASNATLLGNAVQMLNREELFMMHGLSTAMMELQDFATTAVWKTTSEPGKSPHRHLPAEKFAAAMLVASPEAHATLAHIDRWHAVAGMDAVKLRVMEDLIWQFTRRAEFETLKIRFTKGIVLYGPTGCGKSLVAKSLAEVAGIRSLTVQVQVSLSSLFFFFYSFVEHG